MHMQRFTSSIEASLTSQNWFTALFMALALPDICGALESPTRAVGERYKDWFQRFLKARYDPDTAYERLLAISPSDLNVFPPEVIASMKEMPVSKSSSFTAEDCYRLRCKCLHQGLPERMEQDRIHFTAPDSSPNIIVHMNSFNGVLQISIDQFCRDISVAVLSWWKEAQQDNNIVSRAKDLITIYGLDAKELPIVSYR